MNISSIQEVKEIIKRKGRCDRFSCEGCFRGVKDRDYYISCLVSEALKEAKEVLLKQMLELIEND